MYLFLFGSAGSSLLLGLFSSGDVQASIAVASYFRAWALGHAGFSSRGTRLQ